MILSIAVASNFGLYSYALDVPDVATAVDQAFHGINELLEPGEIVTRLCVDQLDSGDEPKAKEVERILDHLWNLYFV